MASRKHLFKYPLQSRQHLLAILGNLVMRNKPASTNRQSLSLTQLGEFLRAAAGRLDIQPSHVCMDRMHQLAAQARPQRLDFLGHFVSLLQQAIAAIVLCPKRLVHSNPRTGGDEARLPHASANGLSRPPRMLQSLAVSHNDASNGCAQALGEAQAQSVKLRAKLLQSACAGHDGLPEARAVAVHLDAVLAGELGDALDLAQGHDHAVERVFETDDPRGTVVEVVADDDVGLDVLESEVDAVLGDDGLDSSPGQRRYAIDVSQISKMPMLDVKGGKQKA